MADDQLTPAAVGPTRDGIPGYLAALEAALCPSPRRARGEILDEIGDGLLAAADRHRDRGVAPRAAVRAALTEFGPPQVVARAFAGELAAARSRRLIATLLVTGPLVGVWWLLLLAPHFWPPHPDQLVAVIPVLPVIAITVTLAVAVLAATGRLAYRLPALSPRTAVRAWHAAAIACLAVDIALLARLVIPAPTPAGHSAGLLTAAAAASLTRLLCVAVAVRRTRRAASTRS